MSSTKLQLVLYGTVGSAPVRAVLLTLKALNLDYEFRQINLAAGEQHSPEYLKKNPLHTVPLLEDGAHLIWDSHAIAAYLVRKYGKDDALYPKDYYRRAVVDQRLHFETGVLFHTCLKQITRPLFYEQATEIPKGVIEQVHAAYGILETLLDSDGAAFVAGNSLTIADFSVVANVSSLNIPPIAVVDAGKYPKLAAWLERMAALPYYGEANETGVRAFEERIRSKLPKQFDKLWQKAVADIKSGKQ